MLSSIRREMAMLRMSSKPVVRRQVGHAPCCRVEGQRDEGLEAACLVLQLAQLEQMVDAVLFGLDVAVEHRAVRLQAQLVRFAGVLSHSSPSILWSQMMRRTRSLKISAPPPGSECMPASLDQPLERFAIESFIRAASSRSPPS
jgi:hypothetical protein